MLSGVQLFLCIPFQIVTIAQHLIFLQGERMKFYSASSPNAHAIHSTPILISAQRC